MYALELFTSDIAIYYTTTHFDKSARGEQNNQRQDDDRAEMQS